MKQDDSSTREEELPHFDDVRKALSFALNFKGETKASVMSQMMSQVKPRPKRTSKKALERYLARFDPQTREIARELLLRAQEGPRARSKRAGPPALQALDKAHLAGYILAQLARLDRAHQALLRAAVLTAYSPCACGAPCCSGERREAAWTQSVREVCEIVRITGDVLRTPGKRGLSSAPALRRALVEEYFTRRHLRLLDLAHIGKCSSDTAAKHKEWIHTYLEQAEREAWVQIALVFDQMGVTGALV